MNFNSMHVKIFSTFIGDLVNTKKKQPKSIDNEWHSHLRFL